VLYPGLADFPGHAVAALQMKGGFGAMLSIRVAGGETAAIESAARLHVWKRQPLSVAWKASSSIALLSRARAHRALAICCVCRWH